MKGSMPPAFGKPAFGKEEMAEGEKPSSPFPFAKRTDTKKPKRGGRKFGRGGGR